MRKVNFPLLIGGIIVTFLILVAFYPGLFSKQDPLFEETPKYIEYKEKGQGVEKFAQNPMRPNKENIFGTDDAGRDVYSRLVYGTRNTLKLALLIAIFRMLLALPLGLGAGMGIKFISAIIKIFNTYFTAIPMLIFSFVILNIGYFRMLQMDKSIIAFAIVLSIVGWAKLAGMIEDSTKLVMEEDFIEGEVAIGKTKLQIAYQNVLPHIIPTSISLFFKEMGMALFLIAQLAVLYTFVGIKRLIKDLAFKASYDMILEPEWGGMLSRIAIDVKRYSSVYWMTLYPILVFSIAIAGINLTGEGLRIEFQKRNSRVISFIRKTYYQLSPKIFISQLKDFKKYYKPVLLKTLIIVGVIAYFIIPWHPSLYKFDLNQAEIHIKELTDKKYGGRVPGTEGGYLAGEYIINTLKEYGYEVETMEIPLSTTIISPVTNNEINVPQILAPMIIESGWIKLTNDLGEEKTYYLHEDFTIFSVNKNIFLDNSKKELNYKGIAADANNAINIPEGKEFFAITRQFPGFSDFYIMNANKIAIGINQKLSYDIEFVLLGDFYGFNSNTYSYTHTAIFPFGDLGKDLENGYREIELNFDYPKVAKYPGRNIMAFLPGKDKTKEDPGELIIIGAGYDGAYDNGLEDPHAMNTTKVATALEVARNLSLIEEPLEKSVQFIFWDNESEHMKHSSFEGSNYYHLTEGKTIDMALTHGYYYIDINYPGNDYDKYLTLVTLPAQRADGNNYLIGLEIEKRLRQKGVKYRRFHYNSSISKAMLNLRLNALTTIGIGNPYPGAANTPYDNLENINYKTLENIGQAILDTITMNSYIMD